jgi:pimeloyl-ACP methyl ester carboxylesterase
VSRLALLLHIREEDAGAYCAALKGRCRYAWCGSGSGAYDEHTGLAARYPTLRGFLEQQVPDWLPGTQLVVAAHSAGGWAALAWMRNAADRKLVSALLLLDCLYGSADGCPMSSIQGAVEYGRLAVAEPAARTLVVTYGPYTAGCAALLRRELPECAAVQIWAPAISHRGHASEVGPQAVAELVLPKLTLSLPVTLGLVAATFGLAAATVMLVQP